MLPHPLSYFEIQKYYQNKPRFNGVYSRDSLQKIQYGAYIINLDEYSDIELIRLLCTYKTTMLLILILLK